MAVKNCRSIGKKDMSIAFSSLRGRATDSGSLERRKLNSCKPVITVDPETYRVRFSCCRTLGRLAHSLVFEQVEADGVHCSVAPATKLPLAQNYMLF